MYTLISSMFSSWFAYENNCPGIIIHFLMIYYEFGRGTDNRGSKTCNVSYDTRCGPYRG